MQCSIDFFNHYRDIDGEFDPGDDALRLAKYAKSIGVTGQTKDKIIESLDFIEQWVDDKPNRKRQEAVSDDIKFITSKIEKFQNLADSVLNAKSLITSCKPKLQNIKNILGSSNELYLQLSSLVVNSALSMIIEVVNSTQNRLEYDPSIIHTLPGTFSSAVLALNSMDSFDMFSDIRTRFNTNKRTIRDINISLKNLKSDQSSDGCYIATMAYGDYDHPQVMVLRRFRDEILAKTFLGRSFITLYYATSPHLVQLLKNQDGINIFIRNILDKFVEKVK